ncbi:MAG TPA: hypothetical protein PK006_12605 [Saprospiraceae bacterium]|nr:hypothetical protein [Saprospiraceae bacterium]
MYYLFKILMVLAIIVSFALVYAMFNFSSSAVQETSFIGMACFCAIFARIFQAEAESFKKSNK